MSGGKRRRYRATLVGNGKPVRGEVEHFVQALARHVETRAVETPGPEPSKKRRKRLLTPKDAIN